ncbi:hypothetical protein F5984_10970 [Rudanella paleaurantiibacter]|uniref:Addiction module protein n=1 Tax=Rudanella paleaurantiibacter TaxID=2614655 RepID=A0A7J5U0T8_9BACT|nr:hypothetical protein [Rudanella paleaurantiibacter]KAB7731310.1 hypothetical protein F5984_10970 [Rudanella paleaurantiibacter]
MSIAEQLHRRIDELNQAQQEELLHTIEQWLNEKPPHDAEQEEREQLIKVVLAQRLADKETRKAKGRPLDEVMAELEKKYDWR